MSEATRRRFKLSPAAMLAVAFGLLIMAWVVSNPAGASPDEQAHYVKALGTGGGDLRGRPTSFSAAEQTMPKFRHWLDRTGRQFDIPSRLAPPPGLACFAFDQTKSASCQRQIEKQPAQPVDSRSYVGSYQPFLYFPAGVLARLGHSAISGILLGRLALGLIAAILMALASLALWSDRGGQWCVVGLLAAATPSIIFLMASLSPNGSEIAAGICFFAVLLRLARPETAPRWLWAGLALSGAVLAASRSFGPAYVAIDVAVWMAILGPRTAWRRWRDGRQWAAGATVVVAVAGAAGAVWELAEQPHPSHVPLSSHVLGQIAGFFPELFHQQIADFGWLDTTVPRLLITGWFVMLVVLVALALLVGARRQRWILLSAVVGVAALTETLGYFVLGTGLPVQGRYVAAVAVVVPIYACEVLRERFEHLGELAPRRPVLLAAVFVAAAQGVGWYTNARRYAVGSTGPIVFAGSSQWQPPLGWLPWGALVAVALVLILAAAAISASSSARAGRASALGPPVVDAGPLIPDVLGRPDPVAVEEGAFGGGLGDPPHQ